MERISRRRFLQISAATFGAATAVPYLKAPLAIAGAAAGGEAGTVQAIPTTCDICFWKCGAIAYVRDGKLWKIEGNPLDPLSRGRLCPRGTGGIGASLDPDRLRAPLLRVGERGKEEWKQVTWDEALDFVADRMKKIKAQYGPESMAMFKHGIGANFVERTMKAYGAINIAAPSYAQCRGPREVGFTLTFGEGVSTPERTDIENAQCLVFFGSHLGENMHNTQVQEFANAVGRGATIIAVDPRFSVVASKAKYWLPVKPGTDIALMRAWMNVIVSEGLYDKEFVAKHGHGFERFAEDLKPSTPEWASAETGVSPDLIRASARELARYRPATLIHPGRRTVWNGDDAQRSRAIALLNALMGNWGRKGGFYVPSSMDLPGYPVPKFPKSERGKVDNPGKKYPFADETITTGVREATITGKPYPIKGWMVDGTNLIQSLPNRTQTIEAIRKLDLLVVVDTIPSEIAGWADVVLPESTYLERYDELNVEVFRQPFIALRQPVVPSPHDQKPGWWIGKQLANKLGLGHYHPWKDIEEYLGYRLSKGGYDFADVKKKGIIVGEKPPIYVDEGAEVSFDTPSGKVEFWSKRLADAGFDPVPKFTPPDPTPAGAFKLLTGRAPVHTFSRTQSNPILHSMMRENEIWVNSRAAAQLGVKSGDYVKLKNQDGVVSNRVRVKATQRIRPDCVYMVHGFGVEGKMLKGGVGRGASTAQLLTRYKTDPLMGGTSIHSNFVTIEKDA